MENFQPIIVVSGGRDYQNFAHVKRVLEEERPGLVIQGECPYGGADKLAKEWCRKTGTPCLGMEALFGYYGPRGGPMRNGWMLDILPVYKLIAFPGGRGTANAVGQAHKREILVRDERTMSLPVAQRIEARSDEIPQEARPEGREPDGVADAPQGDQHGTR